MYIDLRDWLGQVASWGESRPYEWKDDFPAVSATSPELEAKLVEKYGEKIYM